MDNFLSNINPVYIYWRKGSVEDPYVEIDEPLKIPETLKVILKEIPSNFDRVVVYTDDSEELFNETKYIKDVKDNKFFVDYNLGIVYFSETNKGKRLFFKYMGTGCVSLSSGRIYIEDNGVHPTRYLQDLIDEANGALGNLQNYDQEIAELIQSADNKILETEIARLEALEEARNAKEQADRAEIAVESIEESIVKIDNAVQSSEEAVEVIDGLVPIINDAINSANESALNADEKAQLAEDSANEANRVTSEMKEALPNIEGWENKGEFNPDTQYHKNNEVVYMGSSYRALKDTIGNLPTNSEYFILTAKKGADGEGSGSVSSVNGVFPDDDGNIDLGDIATDWDSISGKPDKFPSSVELVEGSQEKIEEVKNYTDSKTDELKSEISNVESDIGDLENLNTNNKENIVDALNEVLDKDVDIDVTNLATKDELEAHVNDGAAHGIGDKSTLLTDNKAEIVGAINELFTHVGDSKSGQVAVIGAPATVNDTWAQLAQLIQKSKDFLTNASGLVNTEPLRKHAIDVSNGRSYVSTAIRNKGVPTIGTESLSQLATKIGQIETGKKWASGTAPTDATPYVTVRGLPFKPRTVELHSVELQSVTAYNAFGTIAENHFTISLYTHAGMVSISNDFVVGEDYFKIRVSNNNSNFVYRWTAYE